MYWIVVTIKPNQAMKAEENLNAQGIDCFFPKLEFENKDKKKIRKNLFPGYGFVNLESWDQLLKVSSTRGISRIITFSGKVPTMPKSVIENIRKKLRSLAKGHKLRELKKDDRVIINASLFEGLEATVMDILNKKDSQVVLLQILNHPQTIWFDVKDISSTQTIFDDYLTL